MTLNKNYDKDLTISYYRYSINNKIQLFYYVCIINLGLQIKSDWFYKPAPIKYKSTKMLDNKTRKYFLVY